MIWPGSATPYCVNIEAAIRRLAKIPISRHCRQGDDVAGFKNPEGKLAGGARPRVTARQSAMLWCRAATWTGRRISPSLHQTVRAKRLS